MNQPKYVMNRPCPPGGAIEGAIEGLLGASVGASVGLLWASVRLL